MIFANDTRFLGISDSETLQNAINAAAKDPSHTVCIPARDNGVWNVDKALLLPSDITVILDNCHLRLADTVYDNLFRNRNMYTDKGEQRKIRLIGRGKAVLDGGGPNDLTELNSEKEGRPHVRANNLILLHHVTDYVIENITCRNLRYWAINQIACTHGRLSDIHFESGPYGRNQDGINFRTGCSHCLVENITGQTGDDTVALSSFPCGSDGAFLPADFTPDIHDIIIRNVYACTHQTLVAMRVSDGAQLYNITVENIRDNGGNYRPWGAVRIGENAYFHNRPAIQGDIHDIAVNGVHSLAKGTVFLNMALKDATIRNVYAGGTSMYAVSTFYPSTFSPEEETDVTCNGVTLENVLFENVDYRGTADHGDDLVLTAVGSDFHGAAFDFRCMRETDTFTNVVCRNVTRREGAEQLVSARPLNITFE